MVIIGFIVTCLLLAGLFLYYRFSGTKNITSRANDPDAQASYDNKKYGDSDKKLSLEEKVELSWQFLYEITGIVLNKFSKQSQQDILKYGHTLSDNGAKYQHSVDSGIRQSLNKARSVNIEQEKDVSQNRAI